MNNGLGGGSYGAGSIVSLTANPPPSGMLFAGWVGGGISNAALPTTFLTMPTAATSVTATYSNLPAPIFNSWQTPDGTTISLKAQAYPNHAWVLQTSPDLINWISAQTNNSDGASLLQFSLPIDPAVRAQFFRLRSP